jgi:type IV secretory pathway VirB10-like protein
MNTSHDRITQLLDRWHASVERHTRYLSLDDAAYAKVEDWPSHQRPARWVVDHARTRLLELRRLVDARRSRGDGEFAEALELMAFLANLVGAEHLERRIPMARGAETPTDATVVAAVAPPRTAAARPRPAARPAAAPAIPAPAPTPAVEARPARAPRPDKLATQVIADAARLLSWGREWPQLAGLIARMADRPPEPEVWTILRAHRAAIERKARRAPD